MNAYTDLDTWQSRNAGVDLGSARGLPNHTYTSTDFFEKERKSAFRNSWIYAISLSEIPKPGDIAPVDVAGEPLIMVRGKDGSVLAFMNVCPHRGSRLVNEAAKKQRHITCPYHAWSFNIDGSLRQRPHFHGPEKHDRGDDPEYHCSLFKVRCGVWHDWVFVNLSGDAPSIEDWFAPSTEYMAMHDFAAFRLGAIKSFYFDANWKLAVENYCDNYHVFSIHPDLNDLMDKHERYAMEPDRTALKSTYVLSRAGRGEGLPDFPGFSENPRKARFTVTFPTFGCAVYPSSMAIAIFKPLAVNRTEMRMLFYYVSDAAETDEHAEFRTLNEDTWTALNGEDEGICQMLQRGREASAYDGGRFASYWDKGTVHFANLLATTMNGRIQDYISGIISEVAAE